MSKAIQIDLAGRFVAFHGDRNPVAQAVLASLVENGGRITQEIGAASIVLLSWPLVPSPSSSDPSLFAVAREAAVKLAEKDGGRVIFLLSAIGGVPMRRHPDYSREMASVVAVVRTLAMEFAPRVLVNAVGFGVIETDAILSGDAAQLSHASVARAGTLDEAVAPVLFFCDPANTYTTGQMLAVDGGWSAGYGRNF